MYICLWLFKYTKFTAVFFFYSITLSLEMSDEPNMIDYLLNITLMADSEAAQLQWIVSTQQWTVLALMILLVAVPIGTASIFFALVARRTPA